MQSQEAAEVAESDTLVREIRALKQDADRIRESAERAGDLRTALAGVRELARLIELQAEMLGELNRQTVVNILVNPQWITLRGAVLRALDPYPDARLAVAEALSDDDA